MTRNLDTRFSMWLMLALVCIFGFYNLVVYSDAGSYRQIALSPKAIEGENLWQEYNCASCHQLYGLGGYIGPDLTNTYSTKGKGPEYIKWFLNSGIKAMPQFHFTGSEKEALVAFLEEVDRTGFYPNYQTAVSPTGWVDIKYKNEK